MNALEVNRHTSAWRAFGASVPRPRAPGDVGVAEEIAEIAKPTHIGLDADSWGIDHGAWSVLVHVLPKADIPVVQLAINAQKPLDYHFDLGFKLAGLRERGVLVLGSGNVVHNLRAIEWSRREGGFDWAERFDDAARRVLTERPAEIATLLSHPDFPRAVPTPDHFVPVLYFAAAAAAAGLATGIPAEDTNL